jgi:UDP-N-acetylglucosamine 2-epimerase (non-hydrolysing)
MKLILVVGARPNFIKIAPLMRAISKHNLQSASSKIEIILVHTGQHYDYEMSQIFFKNLEIPKPNIHLGIGSGSHAKQTGTIMIELEKVLIEEAPDMVIVVGDVNSTLAASLSATKLNIPVAHVEAGIRSHDWTMPEEVNRYLTDHISRYLFTTSEYDDENLKKEGISSKRVFRVGNIVVDSVLSSIELAKKSAILSQLCLSEQNYVLVTLHRPSNVDEQHRFVQILQELREIAENITLIFPVHPRTRKSILEFGLNEIINSNRIKLIEPLGYLDFLYLEMNSKFLITDSGGLQVESTVLDVPCLTVLNSPVWHITHEQGTNVLVGNDIAKMKQEAFKIINGKAKTGSCPQLWDGKTAERIIDILATKAINGGSCTGFYNRS